MTRWRDIIKGVGLCNALSALRWPLFPWSAETVSPASDIITKRWRPGGPRVALALPHSSDRWRYPLHCVDPFAALRVSQTRYSRWLHIQGGAFEHFRIVKKIFFAWHAQYLQNRRASNCLVRILFFPKSFFFFCFFLFFFFFGVLKFIVASVSTDSRKQW